MKFIFPEYNEILEGTIQGTSDPFLLCSHLQRLQYIHQRADSDEYHYRVLTRWLLHFRRVYAAQDSVCPLLVLTERNLVDCRHKSLVLRTAQRFIYWEYAESIIKVDYSEEGSYDLRIAFAYFLFFEVKHRHQALESLSLSTNVVIGLQQKYMLHKTKKEIEMRISKILSNRQNENDENDEDFNTSKLLIIDHKAELIKKSIQALTSNILKFWRNISSPSTDLQVTRDLSASIVSAFKDMQKEIKKKVYRDSPSIMVLYYSFIRYVLFQEENSKAELEKELQKTLKIISDSFLIENVKLDSNIYMTDKELCFCNVSDVDFDLPRKRNS